MGLWSKFSPGKSEHSDVCHCQVTIVKKLCAICSSFT